MADERSDESLSSSSMGSEVTDSDSDSSKEEEYGGIQKLAESKGFKILVKMGWQPGQPLGINGSHDKQKKPSIGPGWLERPVTHRRHGLGYGRTTEGDMEFEAVENQEKNKIDISDWEKMVNSGADKSREKSRNNGIKISRMDDDEETLNKGTDKRRKTSRIVDILNKGTQNSRIDNAEEMGAGRENSTINDEEEMGAGKSRDNSRIADEESSRDRENNSRIDNAEEMGAGRENSTIHDEEEMGAGKSRDNSRIADEESSRDTENNSRIDNAEEMGAGRENSTINDVFGTSPAPAGQGFDAPK